MQKKTEHIPSIVVPETSFSQFESAIEVKIRQVVTLEVSKLLNNAQLIEVHPANYHRFKWLQNPESLLLLYNILYKFWYLRCSWEEFIIHFIKGAYINDKIIFLKPTIQLVTIFDLLADAEDKEAVKLIDTSDEPHIRLMHHFLDKNGNKLVPNTLGTLLNKPLGKKTALFIQNEIIKPLRDAITKG